MNDCELLRPAALAAAALLLAACSDPKPVDPGRYEGPDRLFGQLEANVAGNETLETIAAIDHSRLGAEAGSVMPPARVLIFSDPGLEAALVQINPLVAMDLPLRVLAYESAPGDEGRVIYNSFDNIKSRYGLADRPELADRYEGRMAAVLEGIPGDRVGAFQDDVMAADGIITLESPFDVPTTLERITAAIDAQDDTVWFGRVDFQARAQAQGVAIAPAYLLLFGGPGPGGKAMADAPTLGLDGFCQKLLVWQDSSGKVKVSFNDLLALAERQGVSKSVPLRVINHRLTDTFSDALTP